MCGSVILPTAAVVGRQKKSQIYIIEQAKKMSSGKKHSEDVMSEVLFVKNL
jgi:hypothetical protein